jgi:hypothetical protein
MFFFDDDGYPSGLPTRTADNPVSLPSETLFKQLARHRDPKAGRKAPGPDNDETCGPGEKFPVLDALFALL